MDNFNRRAFLAGSAATMAAWTVPSRGTAASRQVPRRSERHRVIVVGSGFGGAISSLRLTQAGVPVVMLERGKRWASGQYATFPTFGRTDRRAAWLSRWEAFDPVSQPNLLPWKPYTGIVERVKGNGMDIVCGAGVGGSSLPYHGMTFRPRGDLFTRVMPAALDFEEMERVFYPRAEGMLRSSSMPDDVYASHRYRSSRAFAELVRKAGLPPVTRIPMTIDWNVVRQELAGTKRPVISKGDVIYGVNGPGKHSLDTNYIPAAEATGLLDVRPLHRVDTLGRDSKGRWKLVVSRINTDGEVLEIVDFTCDALVMAAGSANTTKLLVRAKATGALPDLPDDTGGYWGSNGDHVKAALIPKSLGTFQGGPANIATADWDNPDGPITVVFGPGPLPVDVGVLGAFSMGIPDGHGRFAYDGSTDQVRLTWPKAAHARMTTISEARLDRVFKQAGFYGAVDSGKIRPTTWHPLGGAVIGRVCDDYGRVLENPRLYVNDGALIPGSTAAVNPSLTVAALAERNAEQLVADALGGVF